MMEMKSEIRSVFEKVNKQGNRLFLKHHFCPTLLLFSNQHASVTAVF